MRDDIMDNLNNGFGKQSNYTMEEIEEATKMKKKYGGTLLENLQKLTGRGLSGGAVILNHDTGGDSAEKKAENSKSEDTKSNNPFSSFINGFSNGVKSVRDEITGKDKKRKNDDADKAPEISDPIRDYVNGKSGTTRKTPENSTANMADIRKTLEQNQAYLDRELENYTKSLKEDFGIDTDVMNDRILESCAADMGLSKNSLKGSTKDGVAAASGTAADTVEEKETDPQEMIEKFDGLTEEICETVFGQKEYIHKLVIAFKRPVVLPPEDGHALNSIFITGKEKTGRHIGLKTVAAKLKQKGVLRSAEIETIDLGLYSDASAEKLFLQDLYSALRSKSRIILFENFDGCHSSFLTQLADLVITGKCRLTERYTMQNGQLVNVSNSLASEAVGSLSAEGKYLIFISDKSVDKVAGIMGAPFINALGDVCVTAQLDDVAYRRIADKEFEELKATSEKQFKFIMKHDESFIDYAVSKTEKQAGLSGILNFFDSCMQGLATLKLEKDLPKNVEITLTVKNGAVTAVSAEGEYDLLAALPGEYSGEIDKIKQEMDEIVGLDKVKEYIFSLEEYYSVQQRRRDQGLKTSEVSKHMIFTGSPGTGKTTIARIISKYLKSIGVLSGGQLVEVSRADLVGRYVGHTAPLTNKVISSAIGGVLFIDEAYSLYRGKDDSFGLEAIDTLVKGIEDNRDNLIVILAGYSNEMQEFLTANSGLKSRFPNVINFPDYTGQELLLIAKSIAKSKGYVIDEGADNGLLSYFNAVQAVRPEDAGNGRLARNKIEEAILNQSRRLVVEKDAELSTLLSSDFDLTDIMSDEK